MKKPTGTWYGIIVLPDDYVWKGSEHACKVMDEIEADTGNVIFWSQDRTEIRRKLRELDVQDRTAYTIEQEWNPSAFRIAREYTPDSARQVKALRAVLATEGGEA